MIVGTVEWAEATVAVAIVIILEFGASPKVCRIISTVIRFKRPPVTGVFAIAGCGTVT